MSDNFESLDTGPVKLSGSGSKVILKFENVANSVQLHLMKTLKLNTVRLICVNKFVVINKS